MYNGLYYGTLKSEVERIWASGRHVIFDVDVKGGVALKEYFGDKALAVFVRVANIEVLKQRLRQRGTESEESFNKRIDKAEYELQFEDQFDLTIVNDSLNDALEEAEAVCRNFILNS